MCSDFPVETVMAPVNRPYLIIGDDAFILRLNILHEMHGEDVQFRRATRKEYEWADSEGGRAKKTADSPDLWSG